MGNTESKASDRPRYWYCIIGPVPDNEIHPMGDGPPRMAARQAILDSTDNDPTCASGWIEEGEAEAMRSAAFAHYYKVNNIVIPEDEKK